MPSNSLVRVMVLDLQLMCVLAFLVGSTALAEQSELQPCTGDVWDDIHKIPMMRKGGGRGGGGVTTRMVQASLVLKQWEKAQIKSSQCNRL